MGSLTDLHAKLHVKAEQAGTSSGAGAFDGKLANLSSAEAPRRAAAACGSADGGSAGSPGSGGSPGGSGGSLGGGGGAPAAAKSGRALRCSSRQKPTRPRR